MNKQGQIIIWGFALMLGLTIIILALNLGGPIKEQVDIVRGVDNLNCTSSNITISDYNTATCVVSDLTIFYFVGGIIFIGLLVIGAKILFSNE